jgi:adenylylsulfate kinase-like enzyme
VSFVVWLTGLSGSGKSAIANELVRLVPQASRLESDVMRTQLTPHAGYGDAERDFFYGALAAIARLLYERNRPVVIDATANRRAYRDAARQHIARFAEVYVDTPLAVCAARDPKGLYAKGMKMAYEPPLAPELVVHGDRGTPRDGAKEILGLLERRGWLDLRQ